jgi:ATP-dependent Clp protease ATP-binding subunit ClpA
MLKRDQLKKLEEFLSGRIIGQEESIKTISDAVLRAELGLRKIQRPKSGMLLLGPTGVGKTEVVLSLAEFLYEDLSRVKRFDMAEYQRQESLNWLLGADKTEQGLLGDAIDELNEEGGGILLFDEIEKAHQSLTTIFLSALDAGRITMSNGQTKNLSQFYIFFTSNLGGSNAAQMETSNHITTRRCVEHCARKYFSSELFARFDEVVVFTRLSYPAQLGICRRMLDGELDYLTKILGKKLKVSDNVFNFLIQKGYTKELGARMMRSAIEKHIGNALVNWQLNTKHNENDDITITVENLQLIAL